MYAGGFMPVDNIQNVEHIGDKIIEVNFAREFKDAVMLSSTLTFKDETLKEKILSTPDEQLLVLVSTINSPKLVEEVNVYDEEFIRNAL